MKIYGYVRISTVSQNIERQIRNIKAEYPEAIFMTDEYTGTRMDRPGWQQLMKKVKSGDVIVFDSVSRMSRNAEEGYQVYEDLFNRGVELIFLKEHHIDTATYKKAIAGQLQISVSTGDGKTDDLISGISAAINQYLLSLAKEQIRLAFDQAEKEVMDLRQRTKEGMETARLNGKQIGNVAGSKMTNHRAAAVKALIQQHSRDFGGNLNDSDVMALLAGKTVTYDTPSPTKSNPDRVKSFTKSAKVNRQTYYKYKKELQEEQ